MKVRRFAALLLVGVMSVSHFAVMAEAVDGEPRSGDDPVVCATGRFNVNVDAGTMFEASSSFPLEVGETVTIKASYSPFSASVDFGLIAPDGYFYYFNTTTGSIDETIEI